jgi:hypothetical protein
LLKNRFNPFLISGYRKFGKPVLKPGGHKQIVVRIPGQQFPELFPVRTESILFFKKMFFHNFIPDVFIAKLRNERYKLLVRKAIIIAGYWVMPFVLPGP